jgi:Kef-type K+ transport system membrane component KefB
MIISSISLPLNDPIMIFSVIISIVFLAPLLLKKANIPDIIGLILAGVLIGPDGLNILSEDIALSIFGTIGLLYLMFLAGLEIDLNDFFQRRRQGTIFGILTFLLPFIPGFIVFRYVLDYSIETSLLVATMLASHTLVSYPILGRLGILSHKVVTISIAGTIIADTVVLILLGIISESVQNDLSTTFWLKTTLYFSVFFFYVLYILPKIARWIFKYQATDRSIQYVFVLTAIFISASIAELLKIEPLIGAFFTGLSLNRLIPRISPLMNRIVFIGNSLFIPFFLISIGMLVNIKILVTNKESWIIIFVLTSLALGGKYIAAWIFQKFNRLKAFEKNLIFGLSSARAASAIAIMLVGYEFNLVNETLMNSTILLILITCLVSSMVTQRAGKKISVANNQEKKTEKKKTEKIMVSVANPDNIEQLIDFSLLIKAPKSESPLYPITVIRDNNSAQNQIDKKRKLLQSVLEHASSADKKTELITRIDVNIIDGIVRAIKELSITKVVIGWNGNSTTVEKLFGSFLDHLLDKTEKQLLVTKLETSLGLSGDIRVFLPPSINQERGFTEMLETLNNLSKHLGRSISFYGDNSNIRAVKVVTEDLPVQPVLKEVRISEFYFKELTSNGLSKTDIIVIVNSRKNALSSSRITSKYPKIIQKYFCFNNLIMIYPNQKTYPSGMYHLYNLN